MTVLLIFALLLGYLYWEYKYSRSAKLIESIKRKEPETYELLIKGKKLYPSLIIHGIVANNQYHGIKNNELKNELLAIDEKQAKYQAYKMYFFVLFILFTLILRVINSE